MENMKTKIGFLNEEHKNRVCDKMIEDLNITYFPHYDNGNEFTFRTKDEDIVFYYLRRRNINFDFLNNIG